MIPDSLYPLQFAPLFKSALWGGERLRPLFGLPPSSEAIGEAWLLSDQGTNQTTILNGKFAGQTLRELMATDAFGLLGYQPIGDVRFPLLLKIIDAKLPLSVQVHPNDDQAREIASERGESTTDLGKTEAWVVLDTAPHSTIYSGLKSGVSSNDLQSALKTVGVADLLYSFEPRSGDCVFLEAGTVHAIGAGLMIFEVQQTSDITYRLYDWDRLDAKTGKPRQLHLSESLRCTDFDRGPCRAVNPWLERNGSYKYERLVKCNYFHLHRWISSTPFRVGAFGECRLVVCISGGGVLSWHDTQILLKVGDVVLLPASVGGADVIPTTKMTLLEIAIPKPVRYFPEP